MSEMTRFPLAWPPGWRRIESYRRAHAQFKTDRNRIGIGAASQRILEELERHGIAEADVVISTNLKTRLDGMPRADQAEPSDPGAAVYWRTKAGTRCMAIDRYTNVAGNLAAIAATLESLRAIERYGGATILDRAFQGFTALPAPEQWFQVLGISASATREQIIDAHRRLAMEHHPDRPGGDNRLMARINAARDDGLASTSR